MTSNLPRRRKGPTWVAAIILVASAMVIAIGVQARLDKHEERKRDAADRAYADCLTEFASDLVTTIKTRNQATVKVEQAEQRRDDAADRVFATVLGARQTPPAATESDFDRALREQIRARALLDAARANAEAVRAENAYVLPEAVCER